MKIILIALPFAFSSIPIGFIKQILVAAAGERIQVLAKSM